VTAGARSAAVLIGVIVALIAGIGWLYVLRGLHLFAVGPPVPDALPLLQLARTDLQPLLRVVLAWLPAGAVAGLALARIGRPQRAVIGALTALVLLLLASQASDALARNLRFSQVLWSRSPGPGPWLEALLFAVGCALPRTIGTRQTASGTGLAA